MKSLTAVKIIQLIVTSIVLCLLFYIALIMFK